MRQVQRVILILWDAFDPVFMEYDLPNVRRLLAEGLYCPDCQSVYPAVTNVCFASMMTGAYPQKTHNLAYYWDQDSNVVRGLHRTYNLESIVEALARGGRCSASVGMFMLLNHGLRWRHEGGEGALYLQPESDSATRVQEAIRLLAGEYGYVPDFLSIYSSELDGAIHSSGLHSSSVRQLLQTMDQQLGVLLDAVQRLFPQGQTAIILTADHGASSVRYSLRNAMNEVLAADGLQMAWLVPGQGMPAGAELVAVNAGNTAQVYFRHRFNDPKRPFTVAERAHVQQMLAQLPGMQAVLAIEDLQQLKTDPALADLVLEATAPFSFFQQEQAPDGERGTHGARHNMQVPLIMSVPGRAAGNIHDAKIVDIAPTIAGLLGAPPPSQAQGQMLL